MEDLVYHVKYDDILYNRKSVEKKLKSILFDILNFFTIKDLEQLLDEYRLNTDLINEIFQFSVQTKDIYNAREVVVTDMYSYPSLLHFTINYNFDTMAQSILQSLHFNNTVMKLVPSGSTLTQCTLVMWKDYNALMIACTKGKKDFKFPQPIILNTCNISFNDQKYFISLSQLDQKVSNFSQFIKYLRFFLTLT